MNYSETIFGGGFLVVFLYFGLRMLKAPAYWRMVISLLIPTVAYAIYASKHWPGGDMVAMHIVFYLAVGYASGLVGSRLVKRKTQKTEPWPVAIVTFFVILIMSQAIFLVVARRGIPVQMAAWFLPDASHHVVHTEFSGVVAHGEYAAKAIPQHLRSRYELIHKLGWKVRIHGLSSATQNRLVPVAVEVTAIKTGQPVDGITASLVLRYGGFVPKTRKIALRELSPGVYGASITFEETGSWEYDLTLRYGQEVYEHSNRVFVYVG